jgi:chromosome segregation ATPase
VAVTIKQLQKITEERFAAMSIRLERSERNYDELHDRIDRLLISNDTFRKEMNAEFREMRSEFVAMRSESAATRSESAEMRAGLAEMRSEFAAMRAESAEMRADIKQILAAVNFGFTQIERRLGALEAAVFKGSS